MKISGAGFRVGILAVAFAPLSACASLPVPGVLEPIFGSRAVYEDTNVCVVDRSAPRGLRTVPAQKEVGSGKLFLREGGKRRRLSVSADEGYALNESWYRENREIRQYGRRYSKHGPRRVVPASALTRGADHEGVPVFLDRNDIERPSALYVPVEPGCIFQPYVAG